MSFPTRKHNLGHFLPSDSFQISTPSVTVTISADMLPSLTPGVPRTSPGFSEVGGGPQEPATTMPLASTKCQTPSTVSKRIDVASIKHTYVQKPNAYIKQAESILNKAYFNNVYQHAVVSPHLVDQELKTLPKEDNPRTLYSFPRSVRNDYQKTDGSSPSYESAVHDMAWAKTLPEDAGRFSAFSSCLVHPEHSKSPDNELLNRYTETAISLPQPASQSTNSLWNNTDQLRSSTIQEGLVSRCKPFNSTGPSPPCISEYKTEKSKMTPDQYCRPPFTALLPASSPPGGFSGGSYGIAAITETQNTYSALGRHLERSTTEDLALSSQRVEEHHQKQSSGSSLLEDANERNGIEPDVKEYPAGTQRDGQRTPSNKYETLPSQRPDVSGDWKSVDRNVRSEEFPPDHSSVCKNNTSNKGWRHNKHLKPSTCITAGENNEDLADTILHIIPKSKENNGYLVDYHHRDSNWKRHTKRHNDENWPRPPSVSDSSYSAEDKRELITVDLVTRESCRLYEAQMEIYFGFVGIQAVFVFASFVFCNYAGGVLGLFGHVDRRCASYILTAVVFSISLIVLIISMTTGIHGFGPYRDDPTLKAISFGNLPLGLIFILHNLSLAYQHNYRTEDIIPSSSAIGILPTNTDGGEHQRQQQLSRRSCYRRRKALGEDFFLFMTNHTQAAKLFSTSRASFSRHHKKDELAPGGLTYFLCCCGVAPKVLKGLQLMYTNVLEYCLSKYTGISKMERILLGVSALELLLLRQPVPRCILDSVVIKRVQKQMCRKGQMEHVMTVFFGNSDISSSELCAFCLSLGAGMPYISAMKQVIEQLKTAYIARQEILKLQRTEFNPKSAQHNQLIRSLWSNLMPNTPTPSLDDKPTTVSTIDALQSESDYALSSNEIVNSQWSDIGFQSKPWRDFRGAGILGALNLLWFSEHHNLRAKQILKDATSTEQQNLWFPFAAAGLNITVWLVEFLEDGYLDVFFYNNRLPPLETFGSIFSFVFLEFSRFWRLSRPANILQFGVVSKTFLERMSKTLSEIANPEAHSEWSVPQMSTGEELTSELKSWIDGHLPEVPTASRWIRRLAVVSV